MAVSYIILTTELISWSETTKEISSAHNLSGTKVYEATQVAALEVWGRLNWRMGILRNSRHQPRIFPKLTRSIFPSHSQANKWEYDIFKECKKFIYRLKHFHIWKIILFLSYYNVKQYELICYPSRSLSISMGL